MVMKNKTKYDEFKSFVTYIDVLTYALALIGEEQFNSDPIPWHAAVYEIWKKYRTIIPELDKIYFTHRPPLPPQSVQVDRLVKVMTMSHEISLPNPRFPTIDMDKDKREKIKQREKNRLDKYSTYISDISEILKSRISVHA